MAHLPRVALLAASLLTRNPETLGQTFLDFGSGSGTVQSFTANAPRNSDGAIRFDRTSAGGNPGAFYRSEVIDTTGINGVIGEARLFTGYAPRTQGGFNAFDFSYDRIRIDSEIGPGQISGVMVLQGGVSYLHRGEQYDGTAWNTRSLTNIRPEDFIANSLPFGIPIGGTLPSDIPATPDFSSNGGELSFGLWTSNPSGGSPSGVISTAGYDNIGLALINAPAGPDASIFLNFGDDAPFSLDRKVVDINGHPSVALSFVHSTPARPRSTPRLPETTAIDKQLIASAVRSLFLEVGLNLDVIVDPLVAAQRDLGATMYFAASGPNTVVAGTKLSYGQAESVDRLNQSGHDVAITFINGRDDEVDIATTVAHELGHTFGLPHFDSNANDSAIRSNIMFHEYVEGPQHFSNTTIKPIAEYDIAHNQAYYLQRWVGDRSPSPGLTPGEWDLPSGGTEVIFAISEVLNDIALFDVTFLGGAGGHLAPPENDLLELGTLRRIDATSPTGLQGVEVVLPAGSDIALFASTMEGGPVDVYLETADGRRLVAGAFEGIGDLVYLQHVDSLGTKTLLAKGTVKAIPEPPQLQLLCSTAIAFLFMRRRRDAKNA